MKRRAPRISRVCGRRHAMILSASGIGPRPLAVQLDRAEACAASTAAPRQHPAHAQIRSATLQVDAATPRAGSITQQPTRAANRFPPRATAQRWTTWSSTTRAARRPGRRQFRQLRQEARRVLAAAREVHSLGSVRALVQTNVRGCARVEVRVEWRRQDHRPLGKGIVVDHGACSGKQTSAEVVLSGKRASTFHTATVLIDALDGEDTYVIYFLPFNIDNGLGKLSARYLPPPRGAQRHGAAGCAGTRRVDSIRAMRTTASRSTPRCDGRRAPSGGGGGGRRRAAASRRTRRSASPPRAAASLKQRSHRRRRWCTAARARVSRLRGVGGGGAAGARRLCGRRRAGAPPAAALPQPRRHRPRRPWRRGGGVPLDKGGTATLWFRDGPPPRRPAPTSQSSCTPTRRRCSLAARTFASSCRRHAAAAEASPEFFRPERRARLAWLDSTRGHDDDALRAGCRRSGSRSRGEKRLCAQAPRRCARVAIAPLLGLPGLPTNLTAAGRRRRPRDARGAPLAARRA